MGESMGDLMKSVTSVAKSIEESGKIVKTLLNLDYV